jgi:putative ABC transport system permease protein
MLRFISRVLFKDPVFAATAILTMALGIGVSTAVFSIANAVLFRPLPFHDPARLVILNGLDRRNPVQIDAFSWPRFEFLLEHARSYSDLAAFAAEDFTFQGGGEAERLVCARVSQNFFSVLGVAPALGSGFGSSRTDVMISHEFWSRSLNSDSAIIGRALELNGLAYTVAGVLPPDFQFLPIARKVDVFIPRPFELTVLKQSQVDAGAGYLFALARLRPGVSRDRAQAEMATLDADYRRLKPALVDAGASFSVQATLLRDYMIADIKSAVLVLICAVGFVLLISCANVAGLLLARALERRKEIAIRRALGAPALLIVGQLLRESLVLAFAGCAAGLALSAAATRLLVSLTAPTFAMVAGVHLDPTAVLFALAASLLCGILFGLAPALQLSGVGVEATLRAESGRGTGNRQRHLARSILIVSQVALSIVLLAGSTLLFRSFERLRHSNAGFDPNHLLTVSLTLTTARYTTAALENTFTRQALDRIKAIPGVISASVSSALPVNPMRSTPMLIDGQDPVPLRSRPVLFYQMFTPDYAKTLRVPLLQGRMFDEHDNETSAQVAMVNGAFVRRYWPDRNPVGASVLIGLGTKPTPVVGVLADVKNDKLSEDAVPEVYVPWTQHPWQYVRITVRTAGDPAALFQAVRRAIAATDPAQPIMEIKTMEEVLDNASREPRMLMVLVGIFSVCAFIMAVVGLYGVISYSVAQRTRELGVRVALGASAGDISRMVIRQAAVLSGLGIMIGIFAALALTRLIAAELYGLSPADPVSYAASATVFAIVSIAASLIPARRAARLNPVDALRAE